MAADVHVRAERDLDGIAPGVGRGLAREVDRPRDAIGIGADRERDALGDARGELDHARARHRDVERDLRLPATIEPLQPARVAVAVDRVVGEVGLQVGDRRDEPRDRHRLLAEVEQRGVAATDAEHEAAARRLLHGRRDVGERRGMARVRVGDAGGEPQPLGRGRRQRDGDERIADEVLRVGEGDAVPTRDPRPARPGR